MKVVQHTTEKKTWNSPNLTVHGNVEKITQGGFTPGDCSLGEKRWGSTDGLTFAGIVVPVHCAS